MTAAQPTHHERMMTHVEALDEGIELLFADGSRGVIPYSDIPEIGGLADVEDIALPNAFEIVLTRRDGEPVEPSWDFARHYGDPSYRPRVEALAAAGRQGLGARILRL